jgi:hypothetical protein
LQEKFENNSSNINVAFQDMKNLIDMAKDMVQLANLMSNKIKVQKYYIFVYGFVPLLFSIVFLGSPRRHQ